ncbi:hypothetical protein GHT06_009956 [Daphnia sinensis]|uniref:Uncharacterized protein n=1 Tax=Daphnia sinensis TaxID=1820382 RepID=A0AAD5PZZ0_9CRUS|nr:hypothetical protein GHT06_009956 [Daphnia sinensis]
MFQIMLNEPAIQSPCGLRAYNTHLGRMLAGPSKETNSKMGQRIIQQMISRPNCSSPEVTSSLTTNSCSYTNDNPSSSIHLMEEKDTETSSIQRPPKKGASTEDTPAEPDGTQDKEKLEKDELKAINFDLSLF